jgi:hypothetical protein
MFIIALLTNIAFIYVFNMFFCQQDGSSLCCCFNPPWFAGPVLIQVVKSFPRFQRPARARQHATCACRASGAEWVAGEQDDREFQSEEEYLKSLELQGWRNILERIRPAVFCTFFWGGCGGWRILL